jgi:putative flippase GtrA
MPEAAPISEFERAARFALVGLASTGLYFVLLALLDGVIGAVWLLAAVCYAASMGANWLVQGRFTFQGAGQGGGRGGSLARSLRRHVIMHLAALGANSAAMAALVDGLGLPLFGAQVLVTGVLAVTTFVVSKRWVFAEG